MSQKILVTYATRAGSTAEVAAVIGETLSARGYAVDVRPVKENPPVDGYKAVLIGSGIRFGQWLPEAVEYIQNNQPALNRVPVALFTVHIMNLGDDEQSRANREAYLNAVRPSLQPVDEAFFAGNGDPKRLSFSERMIGRMVKAPTGDFRDWEKIRAWAETIFAAQLSPFEKE